MRIIAAVTLIFLPGTFTATLFSTSFFSFQTPDQPRVVSHWIWLYATVTVGLTMCIIGAWFAWSHFEHSKPEKELSTDRGSSTGSSTVSGKRRLFWWQKRWNLLNLKREISQLVSSQESDPELPRKSNVTDAKRSEANLFSQSIPLPPPPPLPMQPATDKLDEKRRRASGYRQSTPLPPPPSSSIFGNRASKKNRSMELGHSEVTSEGEERLTRRDLKLRDVNVEDYLRQDDGMHAKKPIDPKSRKWLFKPTLNSMKVANISEKMNAGPSAASLSPTGLEQVKGISKASPPARSDGDMPFPNEKASEQDKDEKEAEQQRKTPETTTATSHTNEPLFGPSGPRASTMNRIDARSSSALQHSLADSQKDAILTEKEMDEEDEEETAESQAEVLRRRERWVDMKRHWPEEERGEVDMKRHWPEEE